MSIIINAIKNLLKQQPTERQLMIQAARLRSYKWQVTATYQVSE